MKANLIISFLLILFSSCENKKKGTKSTNDREILNLVNNFESDLNNLPNETLRSLDQATQLFQDYVAKTNNQNKKDSLFQPYFNFYNLGRKLLKNESNKIIMKYGFIKYERNGKEYLLPTQSEYLENNVIQHLSKPMQKFCNQQLKEFNDNEDLKTIADNTLWWENFNAENPMFFLSEMTNYHYEKWHLKRLLSGTSTIEVFAKDGQFSENANKLFLDILANHPKTKTSKTISEYLNLLERNDMRKTDEVNVFLNRYN